MQENYTKIKPTKFAPVSLVLTKDEEYALKVFVKRTNLIDLQDVDTFVRMNVQSLAKGLAKKVIGSLMEFYKKDGLENQNLSVIFFLPGVVKLYSRGEGNSTSKPWTYALYNKKCYQINEGLVHSEYWKQIQEAFIKEMDDILGVSSYKFSEKSFPRACWRICITE